MKVNRSIWIRSALGALFLAAIALPAQAVFVGYTAQYMAGLGDGGNPATPSNPTGTPDPAPNGLPVCQKGLVAHTNATIPAAGYVDVGTSRSVMFQSPFYYGAAGAPGPIASRTFQPGANGAGEALASTCQIAFPTFALPSFLQNRTQVSFFRWPAAPGTLSAGGGYAGTAGAPFVNVLSAPQNQRVTAVVNPTNPQQFGGGAVGTGGGTVFLGVFTSGGMAFVGNWASGPRAFGHSNATPTLAVTNTGAFTHTTLGIMTIVNLRLRLFPWTTGQVIARDTGGNFTTIRTSTGMDGRNPAGTTGTLQLVSPWEANLLPFLNLWFGGTARVNMNFTPEPGSIAMMGAGVLGLITLHGLGRRRE